MIRILIFVGRARQKSLSGDYEQMIGKNGRNGIECDGYRVDLQRTLHKQHSLISAAAIWYRRNPCSIKALWSREHEISWLPCHLQISSLYHFVFNHRTMCCSIKWCLIFHLNFYATADGGTLVKGKLTWSYLVSYGNTTSNKWIQEEKKRKFFPT